MCDPSVILLFCRDGGHAHRPPSGIGRQEVSEQNLIEIYE